MTLVTEDEVNYDELAESLRVSFRGPLVEADEWRPLAQYVIQLLKMQREACASMVEDADDGVPLQCLADAIREKPLVTEESK